MTNSGLLWNGDRIVDLTLLLAEDLPCAWPGHMPYQQKTYNFFVDAGEPEAGLHSHCGSYQTRWLVVDEHLGTHIDAPAHFIPRPGTGIPGEAEIGNVTVEDIPLEQLIGPAAVIDVSELVGVETAPGHSPEIKVDHIKQFESAHGSLQPGEIVLLRSGWDALFYRQGSAGRGYANEALVHQRGVGWPAPGREAMEYLLGRGVVCVGTDGPSMGSAHDGRDVHVAGLGGGAVFIEGLANLEPLPARGAVFVFAPLKVAQGTGAPGRAFAVVPRALPDGA